MGNNWLCRIIRSDIESGLKMIISLDKNVTCLNPNQ